jgi:hypothetical protein
VVDEDSVAGADRLASEREVAVAVRRQAHHGGCQRRISSSAAGRSAGSWRRRLYGAGAISRGTSSATAPGLDAPVLRGRSR